MTRPPFPEWVSQELSLTDDQVRAMKLEAAFDVFVSRIESAQQRGAADPFVTVTAKSAGGNSRACTKRMLAQLGYEPTQRRAMHRLIAGSPSGWPGLMRIFATEGTLTDVQRAYCRRQLALILGAQAADPWRAAESEQRGA
jgi:hypothetical protein